jgi:hypothetical protein
LSLGPQDRGVGSASGNENSSLFLNLKPKKRLRINGPNTNEEQEAPGSNSTEEPEGPDPVHTTITPSESVGKSSKTFETKILDSEPGEEKSAPEHFSDWKTMLIGAGTTREKGDPPAIFDIVGTQPVDTGGPFPTSRIISAFGFPKPTKELIPLVISEVARDLSESPETFSDVDPNSRDTANLGVETLGLGFTIFGTQRSLPIFFFVSIFLFRLIPLSLEPGPNRRSPSLTWQRARSISAFSFSSWLRQSERRENVSSSLVNQNPAKILDWAKAWA